jgi:hypothetical protein
VINSVSKNNSGTFDMLAPTWAPDRSGGPHQANVPMHALYVTPSRMINTVIPAEYRCRRQPAL